jgi:C4-dicarboxylate transporter
MPFEQEQSEFSTFHRVNPIVNSALILLTSVLLVIPCTDLPFEMKVTEKIKMHISKNLNQ